MVKFKHRQGAGRIINPVNRIVKLSMINLAIKSVFFTLKN